MDVSVLELWNTIDEDLYGRCPQRQWMTIPNDNILMDMESAPVCEY
jgi:hypothetical protein